MGNRVSDAVSNAVDNVRNFSLPDFIKQVENFSNESPLLKESAPSLSYTPNPKPSTEKKLSPCCVCKETKQKRDACIIANGEENCASLIEAHKECMRENGFNV